MAQRSLTSYAQDDPPLEDGSNERNPPSQDLAADSPNTAAPSQRESPLATLYDTVEDVFHEEYPDTLKGLESFINLKPQQDVYITSGLPDGVAAVPNRIGAWKLDFTDDANVTYRATGRAFDDRWGDAAAIIRHRIYRNARGVNAGGKWVLRTQICTGYGNPKLVRNASTDDSQNLIGIRGHSPRENSGDRGYTSGAKGKYETAEEAVARLIARLHLDRQPLHRELPTDGEALNGWNIKRYGIRTARWTRRTPIDNDFDELQLSATDSRVKLSLYNDGDRAADQKPFPVPLPDSIPKDCVSQSEKQTNVKAPIVMPPIVEHVLSYPPEELIEQARVVARR